MTAPSVLPFDAHGHSFVANSPASAVDWPCDAETTETVALSPCGVAVTVTANSPVFSFQPIADGFHGHANSTRISSAVRAAFVATTTPPDASDTVGVNPSPASVCTATRTTAAGASGVVIVTGAGAVTGVGGVHAASPMSNARAIRMAQRYHDQPRSAS